MRLLSVLLMISTPSAALAASGTVNFSFTGYEGPYAFVQQGADPQNPANQLLVGEINGAVPAFAGVAPDGFGFDTVLGTTGLSGQTATFVYNDGASVANVISFTPSSFTDVEIGETFVLGTIGFTNGQWFSGNVAAGVSLPAFFSFNLGTVSATPGFTQSIAGQLVVTTNQTIPQDCTTLAGQQNQADFVSIGSSAATGPLGTLRVFDLGCKAASVSNSGTIQLLGRFGSLELVGLANPGGGGFFAPGTGTGPIGGIPEPDSWALLITGFGLTGAVLRRCRPAFSI